MRDSNRFVITQSALAGLALTLLLGVAAEAIQAPMNNSALTSDQPDIASLDVPSTDSGSRMAASPRSSQVNRLEGEEGSTFSGTIVRRGQEMVLRDESGKTYRLDGLVDGENWKKAKAFEGRPVKVTGRLEAASRLIHVTDLIGESA